MKVCNRCGAEKSIADFPFVSKAKGVHRRECKPCYARSMKAYRRNHIDQWRATEARRRAKMRGHYMAQNRKYRYGLDDQSYRNMLASQDQRCAICGSSDPGMKRVNFAVDHDHKTGRVRALLCLPCNTGLGAFRDSPRLLIMAAKYLEVAVGRDRDASVTCR